jgi:hypothetical protein
MRATECTPDEFRITVPATRIVDPMTGTVTVIAEGFDAENYDTLRVCGEVPPSILSLDSTTSSFVATIQRGTHTLQNFTMELNGAVISRGSIFGNSISVPHPRELDPDTMYVLRLTITDSGGYNVTRTAEISGS